MFPFESQVSKKQSATEGMERWVGPNGYNDVGMSNFDRRIEFGFGEALKASPNKLYGYYTAWGFVGHVWFDGTEFCCEIVVYGAAQEIIKAPTLEEIMETASYKWGYK